MTMPCPLCALPEPYPPSGGFVFAPSTRLERGVSSRTAMAISIIEYQLIRTLREQNCLPLGGDLMEIGEAHWYGDVGLEVLRADIQRFAAPERRQELLAAMDKVAAGPDGLRGWD